MKKILLTATVQSHICQFHRPLVEMLKENGEYEIHVAARDNLAEKNGLTLDFADRVFDVPFERSPFHPKNLRAYRQLKRILAENDYEYIHCNTPVGGVVTRIAARKARKKGSKVFYTAHGFHFYAGASKKNWLLYYPVERLLARRTDTLIAINDEDHRLASERFPCRVARIHGVGVSDSRYYPVSADERLALRADLGFAPEDEIILCVGELLPNKNQAMAIRAMAEVVKSRPNAMLLLAGNGPERDNLEGLARACGLEDRVRFLGYCTTLERYQRIADVGVSCSYREGLGINLIEAMLSENPVIGTRNRGHNELIVEGQNGYLVEADDATELALRIVDLFADPQKLVEMGKNGRHYADQYTFEQVKRELKRIYFA